jgi:hypothetical protein
VPPLSVPPASAATLNPPLKQASSNGRSAALTTDPESGPMIAVRRVFRLNNGYRVSEISQ